MQPINESTRALKECRLCGSSDLARFIDFGQVPLGNNLQLTAQQAKEVEAYKLQEELLEQWQIMKQRV